MNPFLNRDNCFLLDVDLAMGELSRFADLGGHTVVDPTCFGIGRDPAGACAHRPPHPAQHRHGLGLLSRGLASRTTSRPWTSTRSRKGSSPMSAAATKQPEIMAGLIGEIGVSQGFHAGRAKSRCAARRARPRRPACRCRSICRAGSGSAHEVLDVVEAEGADLRHTVLCHMNPSHDDLAYQTSLADRGAFLEYDMIGMDYYYADQQRAEPVRRGECRAPSSRLSRRAMASACCSRRTCS